MLFRELRPFLAAASLEFLRAVDLEFFRESTLYAWSRNALPASFEGLDYCESDSARLAEIY